MCAYFCGRGLQVITRRQLHPSLLHNTATPDFEGAAGFVVGLPEAQKRRLWRSTWLRMVAAYRLHHACRSHVQQHRNQQVQPVTPLPAPPHPPSPPPALHNPLSLVSHCLLQSG